MGWHGAHLGNPGPLPCLKVSWLATFIPSEKSLSPRNDAVTGRTPGTEVVRSQNPAYLSPPCGPRDSHPSHMQNASTPSYGLQKYPVKGSRSHLSRIGPKVPNLIIYITRYRWGSGWTPLSTGPGAQFVSLCEPMAPNKPTTLSKRSYCCQRRKPGYGGYRQFHSEKLKEKR